MRAWRIKLSMTLTYSSYKDTFSDDGDDEDDATDGYVLFLQTNS